MKHIKLGEAAKLISQEWKVLDEGEKEVRFFLCPLPVSLSFLRPRDVV